MDQFFTVPFSLHRIARDRWLGLNRNDLTISELDPAVRHLLTTCQQPRQIAALRDAIMQSTGATDDRMAQIIIEEFATANLLRSTGDLLPDAGLPVEAPRITTVGIVTADRPQKLRRLLSSLGQHLSRNGRRPSVLVVDGSRDPANQRGVQVIVDDTSRKFGLSCTRVDRSGLKRFCEALGIEAADGAMNALVPSTAGASRNALTLLTAGESVLSLDDDVLLTPWTHESRLPGVHVAGHIDLREWRFFDDRRQALESAQPVHLDFLSAHEALLDRPLGRVATTAGCDWTDACGHVLVNLVAGREPRVRVTFAGVAGDSGLHSPLRLLFATGPVAASMAADPDSYRRALHTREVHRIARRDLITHDHLCMAYCMGIANRALLPPFCPVGRNEDGVFGALLSIHDPLAMFAHLSVGVLHDSERPALYDDAARALAFRTRVADLLIALTHNLASSVFAESPASRMRRVGGLLRDIGEANPRICEELVLEVLVAARARELLVLEERIATATEWPDEWRRDAGQYRTELLSACRDPSFFEPIELRDEGPRLMQPFLRAFGSLVERWPDIWEAAAARNGQRPGCD